MARTATSLSALVALGAAGAVAVRLPVPMPLWLPSAILSSGLLLAIFQAADGRGDPATSVAVSCAGAFLLSLLALDWTLTRMPPDGAPGLPDWVPWLALILLAAGAGVAPPRRRGGGHPDTRTIPAQRGAEP